MPPAVSSMRSPALARFVRAQCACAIALAVLAVPGASHGGAYAPAVPTGQPVRNPPTGPSEPPHKGPATGLPPAGTLPATDAVSTIAAWEDWWHFNRDPYLQLKRAIAAGAPATAADEIVSGRSGGSPPVVEVVRTRVLPVLRGIVEKEQASELVGGGMVALARAGEPESEASASKTIPLLVRRL